MAQQLDVRAERPARRHQLIFETYSALAPGEFQWDSLEEGPETWRVEIGRTAP